MKKVLFSDRYKDLIRTKDFWVEFPRELCADLFYCVMEFDEPVVFQPNRYNSWTENSSVSDEVLKKYFNKVGISLDYISDVDEEWACKNDYYEWADILELWDSFLSEHEKPEFRKRINELFCDYDIPLRIVDAKVIKIDRAMFEKDMQQKMLDALENANLSEPAFQNAIDEYSIAVENFQQQKYGDCVFYAEKSYESTMKIACGVLKGTADSLTKELLSYVSPLPSTMKEDGFKEKVLMSLPFLRNNLNVGHGDGMNKPFIPASMAKLALNLCAALNTYIVEVYLSKKPESSGIDTNADDLPF